MQTHSKSNTREPVPHAVLRRRRGRRFKQRLVRLCRLPSSHHPVASTTAADGGVELTSLPWRLRASNEHAHCSSSSVQAEFNPNYSSLDLLSQELVAIEHDLTEIPDDCLAIVRYINSTFVERLVLTVSHH